MPASSFQLSLVIPLLNEEEVFPQLIVRINTLLARLNLRSEVVLVDDGSTDHTPLLIKDTCATHPAYRGIILSRNFGHQLAVSAGMAHARGDAVAILDGDLQDPPEVIAEFYARLQEGFDVVYAVRRDRQESILKRFAYAAFYRLMRRLAAIPIPLDSGDFCLMSRRVVDQINALGERHRFVRGLRSWVGFRQVAHPYPRAARQAGQSKYSFSKLIKLALDGIFTFSEKPLQWSMQCGALIALASIGYAVYIVVWRLITQRPVEGFATLAAGMFFLGGIQLISIGILGEYIGRIHNEVKARPLYVIDAVYDGNETKGSPQPPAMSAEVRASQPV
jgi:glycosyltransferase involved in cell wall biosynthesis